MWPYYPELLSTPVPRYTSFPTAAEFSDSVGPDHTDSALRRASGEASFYLHLPFCQNICWYCGCNTGAVNRHERLTSYLDALHREIAEVARRADRRLAVHRVAFGGGSPNAISAVEFIELVDALTRHLTLADPVWSIELDPRTLTAEWGAVLAAVGMSHASLGVQTFAPHIQRAIGRIQPEAVIARSTALLRDAGVSSLNFDLMYGLPGQTVDDLEATLRRAVALGADRIALFGYAHVPVQMPRQRRIDTAKLPGARERFAMSALGHALLTSEGYEAVGFDHFARPGDPLAKAMAAGTLRRNFQGFTDDSADSLIGLGASAISCFPEVLVQNEKNTGRYRMLLSQDRLPAARGTLRSPQDKRLGAVIEALLCHGRASVDDALWSWVGPGLAPFLEHGLANRCDGTLRIAPAGLPYARAIAAKFDPYRYKSARRFSSAV